MFEFTQKEINTLINQIYKGEINPFRLPINLYNAIYNDLQGVLETLDPQELELLATSLRTNLSKFAAAKTFNQVLTLSPIAARAQDLKTFSKQAGTVLGIYNEVWQKTEKRTAKLAVIGAAEWENLKQFGGTNQLLKYVTAGDSKVRFEHVQLDGIVQPMNSKFWALYFPPNGYNCRCDASPEQSDEPQTKQDIIDNLDPSDVPDIFRNNPAVSGKIFKENHPYFKVPKGYTEFKKQNFGLPLY